MKKKNKKYQCPSCECQTVLFRLKDSSFWCRRCGYEWKKKEKA